jgi:hypothetical protein
MKGHEAPRATNSGRFAFVGKTATAPTVPALIPLIFSRGECKFVGIVEYLHAKVKEA